MVLGDALSDLSKIDPNNVLPFDDALAIVAAFQDPAFIGPLTRILGDDADHKSMFSIIHTIEMFDDETYLNAILAEMPQVAQTAPHWAEVLAFRILNSKPTTAVLIQQLTKANPGLRRAWKDFMEALVKENPDFVEKSRPVLDAL